MFKQVSKQFDVDAYDFILRDRVKCSLKVTPDMTARITNTGAKSLYFDSYEFRGVGENISSSVDMSKIVQLGYQTTKAVGALAGGPHHKYSLRRLSGCTKPCKSI